MNLKKLEISGFKSFANRLEMDFSGGITTVLGPNGCGKTNIVDAIRWVLGEQKTRMLRNTKMENVIFNGTKLRKPLGMAEVHMTLSNDDHALPLDYSEVSIARKLHRSGHSEYFVNGEPARLKDVRGLLIDTGLGSNTYSIIEREMVDSVISDKDQDKRFLLEEAAGVMRYRVQREEALRKIKHTENDLTRLDDILTELDRELRSLRYQMGKAKRYGRLKEKVDRMEAALIKRSLYELLASNDEVLKEKAHHESITLTDDNEITRRETELQEARIQGSEGERKLQDLHEQRFNRSQALKQHEERIAILSERISANRVRIDEDEEEIKRSRNKLGTLSLEQSGYDETIQEKEIAFAEREELMLKGEADLKSIADELDGAKKRMQDRKQMVLDRLREKERRKGANEHLERQKEELQTAEQDLSEKAEQLRVEAADLMQKHAEAERLVETKRERMAAIAKALEELPAKAEEIQLNVSEYEKQLSKANIDGMRCKEKKEYLNRIREEHHKYEEKDYTKNHQIRGMLADHVKVTKEHRRLFEACLAPILQGLLAESKEDAFGCLEDVRRAANGRVQLLYPNGNTHEEVTEVSHGVLGKAIDFVEEADNVTDFLKPYLNGVVVTKTVEDAVIYLEQKPNGRVATLDGVFFDGPGRIVVAGSDDIDMTLLEFDSKIDELNRAIAESSESAARLQIQKNELLLRKEELGIEIADLQSELRAEEKERDRYLEEQRQREIEWVKVKEKLATLTATLEENERTIQEIALRLDNREMTGETDSSVEEDEDAETLEAKIRDLEERRETASESVGKMRLDIATINGELATAREKVRNIEMLGDELKELITSRGEDADRCREEIGGAELEINDIRSGITTLLKDVDETEAEIAQVKESHDAVKERCSVLDAELRELKGKRDGKRENLERCNLELATIDTKITGLLEKARENFNQDLTTVVKQRDFDPTEWEELDKGDLASLRSQLGSFGPVNMLALEEYEEKKDRFDFLIKQKNDLDAAKEALLQAIRRINKEARIRLNETFEKVRRNFKTTFLTLFEGGEADLLFVDSDDPLEANLKIVASPKGKRLHDISSLSGGERALVALSLLFAVYLVKPSPFCVFDEVDAPLDDSNIGRFVNMLKSFTDRTQFIVITHNKKTMEAADNLYGVTMQEPGVSRMISVHIGEVDKYKDKAVPTRKAAVVKPVAEEMTVQT